MFPKIGVRNIHINAFFLEKYKKNIKMADLGQKSRFFNIKLRIGFSKIVFLFLYDRRNSYQGCAKYGVGIMRKIFNKLGRFKRDEKGSFGTMAATSMLGIILAVGTAIDVGLLLEDQGKAQLVADSAVLAATRQLKANRFDPDKSKQVAQDILNVNFDTRMTSIDTEIERNQNIYTLTSQITGETEHSFLGIFGRKNTEWTTSAETKIEFPNIEVVLVLDVSRSMQGTRLANMKSAARKFIENIQPYSDESSYISVSLVPFAEYVNMGQPAENWLHPDDGYEFTDDYEGCVQGRGAVGTPSRLRSNTTPWVPGNFQAIHSIQQNTVGRRNERPADLCPPEESEALLFSTDQEEILNRIEGLELAFGTGTQRGMRWARFLLEPSTRPEFENTSSLPRPMNGDVESYVILLTDGQIFLADGDQNGIRDRRRSEGVSRRQIGFYKAHAVNLFNFQCNFIANRNNRNLPTHLFSISYSDVGRNDSELDNALSNCVAGDGRFYSADTDTITDVFADVSRTFRQVRITG